MSEYSAFLGMKGQHFSSEAVRMLAESRIHSEKSGFFNNTIWTVGPAVAFWAHSVCSAGEHILGGVKDACFAPTYLFKDETAITVLNIPKHLLAVPYKSLKALTARWADAIFCLVASTIITVTIVAFAILGFGRGAVAHDLLGTATFTSNDPTQLRKAHADDLRRVQHQVTVLEREKAELNDKMDGAGRNIQHADRVHQADEQRFLQVQQQNQLLGQQVLQLQQAADPVRQMFVRARAGEIMQLLGNPVGDVATAYRAKAVESPEAVAQLNAAIDVALQRLQVGTLEHNFLSWLKGANYDNILNWIAGNKHEEVHQALFWKNHLENYIRQNGLQVPDPVVAPR